jgi:glycosyltransferase involved in cell wall biosynthesis
MTIPQALSASVIIPTYNKARYLELTLASFAHKTNRGFELVITDDGSTDNTRQVVERYLGRMEIRYLRQENRGRSAARNAAVSAAGGDILIFSDDDRIVSPTFVAEHVRSFSSATDARLVQGWQRGIFTWWLRGLEVGNRLDGLLAERPELERRLREAEELQVVTARDLEERFEATARTFGLAEPWWEDHCVPILRAFPQPDRFRLSWMLGTTGNMSAMRRQVLEVGMFDERFLSWGLEDTDLCYRLVRAGARLEVSRPAVSYHQVHPTSPVKFDEWDRNFARFTEKFGGIDLLLFLRVSRGQLGAVEADALAGECERLLREGRPLVVEELQRGYRQLAGLGPWR